MKNAVEIHLVILSDQWVSIGELRFHFREGETIHTESPRKFNRDGFKLFSRSVGWQAAKAWSDEEGLFCVFALSPCVEG